MRTPVALAIASILMSTAAYAQTSPDAPKRMPGLWEMTTIMGEKGGTVHNFQMCIDAQHDDILLQPGEPVPHCTRSTWRRDGHYLHFDAECTIDGADASLQGVFSGDFAYNFQGEVRTGYASPRNGPKSSTMHMEGRRLASCRAGQTPGEFMKPVR
jgi:hypothetical protein